MFFNYTGKIYALEKILVKKGVFKNIFPDSAVRIPDLYYIFFRGYLWNAIPFQIFHRSPSKFFLPGFINQLLYIYHTKQIFLHGSRFNDW